MLFTADIGNTNITIGIFDENNLVDVKRIETFTGFSVFDFEQKLEEILKGQAFEKGIICSVVDEITDKFKQACDKVLGLNTILLRYNMDLGLVLKEKTASTIGADRLANAVAALSYNLPVIVVDVGTAVTFDIVDENKKFLGGIIMPGVNIGLKGLADYTSKLPEIVPEESPYAIGDSTKTCILSGVIRGTACAIEGLINQCENELGQKATVVLTGGQCKLISKYMTRQADYINSDLTLIGLKNIIQNRVLNTV